MVLPDYDLNHLSKPFTANLVGNSSDGGMYTVNHPEHMVVQAPCRWVLLAYKDEKLWRGLT